MDEMALSPFNTWMEYVSNGHDAVPPGGIDDAGRTYDGIEPVSELSILRGGVKARNTRNNVGGQSCWLIVG